MAGTLIDYDKNRELQIDFCGQLYKMLNRAVSYNPHLFCLVTFVRTPLSFFL